jgi:hypothetical protein
LFFCLLSAGLTTLDGEWRRGHPFAWGSRHFVTSSVVGVGLAALLVAPLVLPLLGGA